MMSLNNRDHFLDKIAEKLGRKRVKDGVKRPQWKYVPQWRVYEGESQDRLAERLEAQCARIHTGFRRTDTAGLPVVLAEEIKSVGKSVIIWNDPRFREYGLEGFFEDSRAASAFDIHVWDPALGEENIHRAEQADVGITFSDMTLAESGTVVLFSGDGKGRSVSLLPRAYIAIVPKSTIVPRMSQATREIHQWVERGQPIPSCINFISGPSNSADIEMNLIVGVHGPVKAVYILVEDR